MTAFQFTTNWFDTGPRAIWEQLLPQAKPTRILEIGSYEGASACYLIQTCSRYGPLELHAIDNWEGGIEHQPGGFFATDMSAVESRFHHNTKVAIEGAPNPVKLVIHKGRSDLKLVELLAGDKRNYFEFVYIDGSHQAPDVLCDAVLAFRLLRVGGIMAFDDYVWSEPLTNSRDFLRCPKPGIDAFTSTHFWKIRFIAAVPIAQVYVQKLTD